MLAVSWILCGFTYFLLYCYLFSSFVCNEKLILSKKIVIISVGMALINFLVLRFDTGYLRPFIFHIYLYIFIKLLYKKTFVKTLLGILGITIILFSSELVYGVFGGIILKISIVELSENFIGYTLSNGIILSFAVFLARLKFVNKTFLNIIKWYNENELKSLSIFAISALIIATFVLYNNFITLLPTQILLLTNFFCVAVFIFVIGFFKEKSNNNRIIIEYDQLLDYVKTYEVLLEEKRKNQHEYKNQLVLLKNLVSSKKALKYIDDLLNEDRSEGSSEWLNKLKYIPQGGLKGLIYYKIQTMLNNKIDIYIDVSKELEIKRNWRNIDKNLYDISRVVGVYIDNAVEAANNASNKYIVIEIYIENNNIVFCFSNTYNEAIDLNKIDKEGYTTKGKGKGYGLSLVKDIISKNDFISQTRELNGMYFVQKLYIKK